MATVVWMFQHPSNMNTFKEYQFDAAQTLEAAWQRYTNGHGSELVELTVGPDPGTPVVVSLRFPMTQCSPGNCIYRAVRRFEETLPTAP